VKRKGGFYSRKVSFTFFFDGKKGKTFEKVEESSRNDKLYQCSSSFFLLVMRKLFQ
jgi:hypothetical protein